MKNIFSTAVLLLLLKSASACDICGCSSGSYFIGPYPTFQKHFVGVRYSFRKFESRMDADPSEFSNDLYQTVELYGAINIGKRWQLIGFLPYNINRQEMEHHAHTHRGVGDVTVLVNYGFVQRANHQLWGGIGIKAPTGHFNPSFDNHPVPNANIEPGSGSADLLLNITDIHQWNKWGLFSNINYKLNGEAKEFRFGNRFNASAFVYRSFGNKMQLRPNAGLFYEELGQHKLEGEKINDTDGRSLLGSFGIEAMKGRINIGANLQLPLAQNLSSGQTKSGLRGMIQCSIVF